MNNNLKKFFLAFNLLILLMPLALVSCFQEPEPPKSEIEVARVFINPQEIDFSISSHDLTYQEYDWNQSENQHDGWQRDGEIKLIWNNKKQLLEEDPIFWNSVYFTITWHLQGYNEKTFVHDQLIDNEITFLNLDSGNYDVAINVDAALDNKITIDKNGQKHQTWYYWKIPGFLEITHYYILERVDIKDLIPSLEQV